MTHSLHSSNASVSCRLDWRPSRWLIGALLLLGLLAAFSVLVSEMPRLLAWPSAVAALAGSIWRACREWRKPARAFVFPGDDRPVLLDGEAVEAQVQWRGPLAFVRWRSRDGRSGHLAWWPDTLPAARRRELRLAAKATAGARQRQGMAT